MGLLFKLIFVIAVHEQEVVPWVDEKMVRLCPSCSRSFHLARRKHHCRLCGFVMCNDCSYSLDLDIARKLMFLLIYQVPWK